MLTLITYAPGFGTNSLSPFCVKAIHLLRASGQDWQREDSNDPRRMPRAKLPVLRTDTELVHDSDAIRILLEDRGADFMPGLSPQDRMLTHMLSRMAEEHLYFILVLDRWERHDVWPTIRDTYFREIPAPLRKLITAPIRKNLLRGMQAQGIGRMTWEERMTRVEQDLTAITAQLGSQPFLFGDVPTLADFCVAPVLDAMRKTPVTTELSTRIAQDKILVPYLDRINATMDRS